METSKEILERLMRPFDITINRNTGKPHEHRREIARRKRQLLRNKEQK